MQGDKSRLTNALVFTLLALLLHIALVIPLIKLILSLEPSHEESAGLQVDLWNRASSSEDTEEEEKTPEEELEEYEPKEEIPDGQVVKTTPSPDQRKPKEKAKFLSEQNSRVEKETKSKIQTPGTGAVASSPRLPGKGRDSQTERGGMRSMEAGVSPSPSELTQAENGELSSKLLAPPSLNNISLQPSTQAMAKAIAGTGLDHLEDVIDGDSTALNTMGWQYASFFNRVKTKVEQFWKPGSVYRKRDPYGNIYGFKDRTTVLLVVLHPDGVLKNLYIMDPSGAGFLDDEAHAAVTKASPFPNVPSGLRDKRDGLVKFTFHFIVEVGSRPVVRMRRYN